MTLTRRTFLAGLAAPALIRPCGLVMTGGVADRWQQALWEFEHPRTVFQYADAFNGADMTEVVQAMLDRAASYGQGPLTSASFTFGGPITTYTEGEA